MSGKSLRNADEIHRRFSDTFEKIYKDARDKYMIKTKKHFLKKVWLIFFLVLFIEGSISIFGSIPLIRAQNLAQENGEETDTGVINTYRDSIVRVESICWNGEDVIYGKKVFSGFVVSKDTSGVYVVTVHNNLTYSSAEKKAIEVKHKKENNVRISEKVEVVFNGDLRVKASILGESEQRDLTILKLEQSINFDSLLQFPEQDTVYKNNIYLLGYPTVEEEKEAVYNSENVRITEGTRLGEFQKDDISFFTHDIQVDEGCIGGPLLYSDGTLAGVFLTINGEEQGVAIDSESVKSFLNTFQVPYEEKKTVEKEKKLPVLNIALGVVIVFLILMLFRYKRKETETKSKRKKSKNPLESEFEAHASIEYPAEKRIVLIRKKRFIIGRTKEADFILGENKGISRQHACIVSKNGEFYLSDMESTNHTFLNGSELMKGERRVLQNADEIMVGKERLIFYKS